MKELFYEFVDIDSDESFHLLGRSLGATIKKKALDFDNSIARGELVKSSPEEGLWIRKWKFTVFQKLTLRKVPPPEGSEKKFILIYFIDPSLFLLKNKRKNISVTAPRNNMFLTSDIPMDFSVVPKHPFYVLDIAFTTTWLAEQLKDTDPFFKKTLDEYISTNATNILMEPCSVDDYKLLKELEALMQAENEDVLFIRSRVYKLLVNFFGKVVNRKEVEVVKGSIHYEQMAEAEMMILQDLTKLPPIEKIAGSVNMSISSLLRQFKKIYGKTIGEYHLERKMEYARTMMLENRVAVKEIAEMLGYKQASAFIKSFTKAHGYSPGTLKNAEQ